MEQSPVLLLKHLNKYEHIVNTAIKLLKFIVIIHNDS